LGVSVPTTRDEALVVLELIDNIVGLPQGTPDDMADRADSIRTYVGIIRTYLTD
jgi:hypothetical protein